MAGQRIRARRSTSSTIPTKQPCSWTTPSLRVPVTMCPRSAPSAHTLSRWRTEILNHHRTGASNGPTEGMNFCAKQVKRAGRGFTNFDHYRLRVLLHAGGVTWPSPIRPPRIAVTLSPLKPEEPLYMRRNGHKVIEVGRPPRKGERRLSGKSDAIDAEHAAREVLAGKATATPKLADGLIEAIRLVKIPRDTAVKAHSMAVITLKATLVTASDKLLRGELGPLTDFKLTTACAALQADGDLEDSKQAMLHVLGSLARRWFDLHEEIKVHSRQLEKLTKTAAPEMIAAFGIGPDVAAELLVTGGDNTDRIRSDAALAKLCGACPIPAGSGMTDGWTPTQPRGEPPSELRFAPNDRRPHAMASPDHGLCGATNP